MKNNFFMFIKSLLFFLLVHTSVFAKEINLYDQPKTDAKVVGKIDLSKGIIPIYTPKEGNWIKVGDPQNGNVGWIKSNDISDTGSTVTFTQRIINEGQGPHTYQIIEYGHPQKITNQQVQDMVQRMQIQQQQIQQSTQKAVQDMMRDLQSLYKQEWNMLNGPGMPIVMPIVIMPAQKGTAPQKTIQQTPNSSVHPTPGQLKKTP